MPKPRYWVLSDMFANLLIADKWRDPASWRAFDWDLWGVNQIPLRPKAWRGDAQSQETLTTATVPTRRHASISTNLTPVVRLIYYQVRC